MNVLINEANPKWTSVSIEFSNFLKYLFTKMYNLSVSAYGESANCFIKIWILYYNIIFYGYITYIVYIYITYIFIIGYGYATICSCVFKYT